MDKQTRLEHYKILLDAFKKRHEDTIDNGLCWCFKEIIGTTKPYSDFRNEYPELYAQKPIKSNNWYWWPLESRKLRIEALKKAIELCQ